MNTTTLHVRKDQLGEARLATTDDTGLAPGQVRVRIDQLALTANNVTYAAFGEAMQYWRFFPTAEEGWGIVPAWGFGTVEQSQCPGVAVGERLWGYWPMADQAVLQPEQLDEHGFSDAAPHRAALSPVYNLYRRCNRDPFYSADGEDLQAVLRPLFTTAWLIDDFLAENDFFGATTVLFSSASSKTAWATAFHLQQRKGLTLDGFTAARNRHFCEELGCYDSVLAYQQLDRIDTTTPCVYIDFSGDAGFRAAVHHHFPQLRYSCAVGGTHIKHLGGVGKISGPKPTMFFAPDQARKRLQDWGPEEFSRRAVESWRALRSRAEPLLKLQRHAGPDATLKAWQRLAAGDTNPSQGHIVSLR